MNFLSNVNAVRGECKRLFTVLCNCKVIFICFFFIIQSDGWRQCVCTPMVRHFLQGIRQKIHLCRNEDWQVGCSELCERWMQVNTKGPTAFPKGGKMQLNFPDISMMIMIIWCFTITQVVVSVSLIARGSDDFCLMLLEVSFPGCLGGLVVWRRRSGFPPHDQPRRQQLIIWGRHVPFIAFPRVFFPTTATCQVNPSGGKSA